MACLDIQGKALNRPMADPRRPDWYPTVGASSGDPIAWRQHHPMSIVSAYYGRRALVTGSSRGIGRAIAEGLAQHGADVAIHATRREAADSLARDIGQADDCVGASLLLCSQAGRYITGVDLLIDGSLHLP